jgi:hypothetical protein
MIEISIKKYNIKPLICSNVVMVCSLHFEYHANFFVNLFPSSIIKTTRGIEFIMLVS